ncbi:MAG: amidophosphoribosyltransferase [Oscillospiraceae bacterium]|nr:amidophosphoribosyltransferase [Oscillospiraceae bacterium]
MGGFFGVTAKRDAVMDIFFGTDYHSHLGTRRGGMAVYSQSQGFQRAIHNIENTPFRTRFEADVVEMEGNAGIGCISDLEPQPLTVRSHLGAYVITTVGRINNEQALVDKFLSNGRGRGHFLEMSGGRINPTELVAALINEMESIPAGIRHAQEAIDGSMSVLILTEGELYAARDLAGRIPVLIGKSEDGFAVSFESFAYQKLGYDDHCDLGPGEVVRLTPDGLEVLFPAKDKMKICAFLWTYYGYPNSHYEGVTVESMRYACGKILAENDAKKGFSHDIDYVAGVPDSGTPHAIGYANQSGIQFARPFIKYTPTWPRSFMPGSQKIRSLVAKMKLVPVGELIENKRLLFIDDSIVRGTQMQGTVDFLRGYGAKEVHIRSACPPIMYGCKYLNFSRSTSEQELITRRTITELEGKTGEAHLEEYADSTSDRGQAMMSAICDKLRFSSLDYQTLDGLIDSIGVDPSKLCTYCWTGKE